MHLLTLISYASTATAAALCPILGPVFPPAKSLHETPIINSALNKLRSQLDDAFNTGESSKGPANANDTYSIQIFSASDEEPIFDYHHRGTNLVNSSPVGGDSLYRIGSTTKLFTVYLLLLEAGDGVFNEPITRYLPELKGKGTWDEITVGALASHLGGLPADLYSVAGIAPNGDLDTLFPDGRFPQFAPNETSPCILNVTHCTREEALEALQARPQTYLPNTTPAYSNTGFVLLGFILETITGKSYEEVLQKALVEPLKLKGTTSETPKSEEGGVILGDQHKSGWNIDLADTTAMGGAFSSVNDLSAIGRAILSSSLLSPNITRAWMKPTSFTSSLIGAVGRPWEIYRASVNAASNRVIDIYTKGGNVGVYSATLALIPDFDVGFTILVASELDGRPYAFADLIAEILLPAVEDAAREESNSIYAGTYTAKGINSTVTLTTTQGKPGLGLERWISNSSDMMEVYGYPTDLRVFPTNIESNNGDRQKSWRAVSNIELGVKGSGPFTACPTWFGIDRPTWGLWGIDEFTFHLSEGGEATSLELKALKVIMEKE